MSQVSIEALIDDLADDLRPVKRIGSPWGRASVWLGVVAAVGAVLASFGDLAGLADRLRSVPDMELAVAGSLLTALLGAVATFQLSMPDRSPRWSLLLLPGLALWAAGTGMGCLRSWAIPDLHAASLDEARSCFMFITALSLPLSILMLVMVRRAFTLRPNLVAATGGMAVAAAAATLLNVFHPYDVGATDVAVHAMAIGLVILANRAIGGRLLAPSLRREGGVGS